VSNEFSIPPHHKIFLSNKIFLLLPFKFSLHPIPHLPTKFHFPPTLPSPRTSFPIFNFFPYNFFPFHPPLCPLLFPSLHPIPHLPTKFRFPPTLPSHFPPHFFSHFLTFFLVTFFPFIPPYAPFYFLPFSLFPALSPSRTSLRPYLPTNPSIFPLII
jgi:hypothetical protein